MKIAIIGGTGFLGQNLARYILSYTDWSVSVLSSRGHDFEVDPHVSNRIRFFKADILDPESCIEYLKEADVVYYFVHMMGKENVDYAVQEQQAAHNMKSLVESAHIKRVVYMGGLGNDADKLSKHLKSRHTTGKILRSLDIPVIEFQASMILAKGSVSFDIISNLVDKLPIMLLPKTSATLTQPIDLDDTLKYLHAAAVIPIAENQVVQIGGPDVLSYGDIYRLYAIAHKKRRLVISTPFIPAWIEAKFLDLFTPTGHSRIGKAMVESLGNQMTVESDSAAKLFPDIKPIEITSVIKNIARANH